MARDELRRRLSMATQLSSERSSSHDDLGAAIGSLRNASLGDVLVAGDAG